MMHHTIICYFDETVLLCRSYGKYDPCAGFYLKCVVIVITLLLAQEPEARFSELFYAVQIILR